MGEIEKEGGDEMGGLQEKKKIREKNKFYFFLGFLVIIILIVIFSFVIFFSEKEGLVKESEGLSLKERIEICLEKQSLGEECGSLFSNPKDSPMCENLGGKRDLCFFNFAVVSSWSQVCYKINALEIKEECLDSIDYFYSEDFYDG